MSRSRPPIGPAFTLRLPPAMTAAVDQLAETEGVSRAAMIRRIIAADLRARTLPQNPDLLLADLWGQYAAPGERASS